MDRKIVCNLAGPILLYLCRKRYYYGKSVDNAAEVKEPVLGQNFLET